MSQEKPFVRVKYFDGQFLRTEDFRAEQQYVRSQWQCHQQLQHTAGVVEGLDLKVDEEGRGFLVTPGAALTGDGSVAVLNLPYPVSADSFDKFDSDRLSVYIVRREKESTPISNSFGSCGLRGTSDNYRVEEQSGIEVTSDLNRKVTKDGKGVYLGDIVRDLGSEDAPYAVEILARHNAGLRASEVRSVSEQSRLHLSGGTGEENDGALFAVIQKPSSNIRVKTAERSPLEVYADHTRLAETKVTGDLEVSEGALAFAEPTFDNPTDRRVAGTDDLFKIFVELVRQQQDPDADKKNEEDSDNAPDTVRPPGERQMRVVFPQDGKIAFGYHDESGDFVSVLTISEKEVRIRGNLFATGAIQFKPEPLPSSAALQAASGILGNTDQAALLLQAFNQTAFSDGFEAAKELLGERTADELMEVMPATQEALENVAKALLQVAGGAAAVKSAIVEIAFLDDLAPLWSESELKDLFAQSLRHGTNAYARLGEAIAELGQSAGAADLKEIVAGVLSHSEGYAGVKQAIEDPNLPEPNDPDVFQQLLELIVEAILSKERETDPGPPPVFNHIGTKAVSAQLLSKYQQSAGIAELAGILRAVNGDAWADALKDALGAP